MSWLSEEMNKISLMSIRPKKIESVVKYDFFTEERGNKDSQNDAKIH